MSGLRQQISQIKLELPNVHTTRYYTLDDDEIDLVLDAVIQTLTTSNTGMVIPVTRKQDRFDIGYIHARRDLLAILTEAKSDDKEAV